MIKYLCLILLGLYSCTADVSSGGPDDPNVVQIQSIMDLTPSERGINRAQLEGIDRQLRRSLKRWITQERGSSSCMDKLSVQIQPRLVYGADTTKERTRFISAWSALIRMNVVVSRVSAQVEIVFDRAERIGDGRTLDQSLSQGVIQFAEFVHASLSVLTRSPSELKDVLKQGTCAEKKLLLERISLCGETDFDVQLDDALTFATDADVRFRLVGLIGERRRHGAAHQLIDLINLNDIEWTRSIIRTLSTLEHPRTLELISILAVHDSPALQKELKSALDRLERR